MKLKTVLVLMVLLFSLTGVSAGFFDDDPENITILGVEFNIPFEYKEVENFTTDVRNYSIDGYMINSSLHMFKNEFNNFYVINVIQLDENFTLDDIKNDSAVFKEINGRKGYFYHDDEYVFEYIVDGKDVIIETDRNITSQIIL